MMGFGLIISLLFLGLIVWVFTKYSRNNTFPWDESGRQEDPLEILKRRYAQGEISKKQYEEMKKQVG